MTCKICGIRGGLRRGKIRRFNSKRQVARHMEKEHDSSKLMEQVREEARERRKR